ncbi:MAG: glycosyltransferase [Synergistaceae bacterium]|nr:glycosyltransferase [Synergistaceae bacterium]
MNNFDVSVIVPVYGVEKYIKVCVDSILNQTLSNLEVVLVNDCTPDNSMKICEELYGNNERVQLINQPRNMGAGEARNRGIQEARGKYIGFVDSDDQVQPEMFEKMFSAASKFNADVVHNTGLNPIIPAKGEYIPVDMTDKDSVLSFVVHLDFQPAQEVTLINDDMDERLDGWLKHKYHWAVWNQLYKREFLLAHNIKFGEMKLAEDLIFSLECLFNAKNYVVNPGGWYIYRPSFTSLSRSTRSPKGTLKAVSSQLNGLNLMKSSVMKIAYFRDNPEKFWLVLAHMMKSLEDGFIRIDYQNMGEDGMRADNVIHDFFVQEFGDKAEYVEFLFYELHRNYPAIVDGLSITSDPKVWETVRKNYPKYLQTHDFKDLWEGFAG